MSQNDDRVTKTVEKKQEKGEKSRKKWKRGEKSGKKWMFQGGAAHTCHQTIAKRKTEEKKQEKVEKKFPHSAGFEPARGDPKRFLVSRLNRSATNASEGALDALSERLAHSGPPWVITEGIRAPPWARRVGLASAARTRRVAKPGLWLRLLAEVRIRTAGHLEHGRDCAVFLGIYGAPHGRPGGRKDEDLNAWFIRLPIDGSCKSGAGHPQVLQVQRRGFDAADAAAC